MAQFCPILKGQKWEKHNAEWTTKKDIVYSMRAESSRQSASLFDLRWEPAHRVIQSFRCSVHVCK